MFMLRLLPCIAMVGSAGIETCAHAITIVPADSYDASIDAKSKAIAKDISISNYAEKTITAPNIDVPIGLNVSFTVSQTQGNSFSIDLRRNLSSNSLTSRFGCQATEKKYSSSSYEVRSGELKKRLDYHCMPNGREWDKNKHSITVINMRTEDIPQSESKAGAQLSVIVTNPNCHQYATSPEDVGCCAGAGSHICMQYKQDITSKLPLNINLDNAQFWYDAFSHSTGQALKLAGYSLCTTGNVIIEYYCHR